MDAGLKLIFSIRRMMYLVAILPKMDAGLKSRHEIKEEKKENVAILPKMDADLKLYRVKLHLAGKCCNPT